MQMPRFITSLALTLGLLTPVLVEAQGFEGTVTMRQVTVGEGAMHELLASEEAEVIDPQKILNVPIEEVLARAGASDEIVVTDISYAIKGQSVRVEGGLGGEESGGGAGGYMLLDFAVGTFQMVSPAQRMYIEFTQEDFQRIEEMTAAMGMAENEEEEAAAPQIRALEKTMQINGMRCEAYEITMRDRIAIAWVTDELGDLAGFFRELEERLTAMAMLGEREEAETAVFRLIAEHGFPVRQQTFTRYDSSTRYEITEVSAVERGPLPDGLFVPPSDYQKRTMMDMLQPGPPSPSD